jgi:hypothetical protein
MVVVALPPTLVSVPLLCAGAVGLCACPPVCAGAPPLHAAIAVDKAVSTPITKDRFASIELDLL